MVADDEPAMRQLLTRALSRLGFDVTPCADGSEALGRVAEREGHALLVLDYAMPGLNGADVCREIRAHADAAVAQTPIILLTAHTTEAHEIECLRAGADDFVSKPVHLPVLRARIDTHLRLAALRARLREQYRQLETWRALREEDLEAAGLIQRALMPRAFPAVPGWRFALHSQPVIQVGGDSFDAIPLPGGGLLVWIADATGHGVAAALVTVLLKLLFQHAVAGDPGPATVLDRVNREFIGIFKSRAFLTAACLRIEPGEGSVRFAGAGHPPALVVRRGGGIEPLPSSAPLLGLPSGKWMLENHATLEPGDGLLLLTDGIYGVGDPGGERFSFNRFTQAMGEVRPTGPEQLVAAALEKARAFAQGTPFDDDVALVALWRE